MLFEGWFFKHNFKHKILAIAILSTSLALILMSIFILIYNLSTARNELVEKVKIQADILSQNSAAALVFKDKQTAKNILRAVSKDKQISFVGLYHVKNNSLFAQYRHTAPSEKAQLQPQQLLQSPPDWRGVKINSTNIQVVSSVIWNSEEIGLILVQSELFKLQEKMFNQVLIILAIFILSILFASVLSAKLQILVTRPINKLVAATQKIAQTKDYSILAEKETEDELGLLVDSFNAMLKEIKISTDQRIAAEQSLQLSRDKLQDQVLEQTQEIRLSMEKVKQSSQAKSEFLANMSHEIRTPMNAIVGLAHLALDTELNNKQKNYMSNIDMAAKSLLSLINDILDLSKIEAQKLTIEKIPFQLDTIKNQFTSQYYFQAKEKNLEFSFDIAPKTPDVLLGDALRLTQILTNLTNNALKFTHQGFIKISVQAIEIRPESCYLQFSVQDSGIGMSQEQLPHLFEAFNQADSSTTRVYGGTGLGLSICKQLTDLMQGEIHVETQEGKGSQFIFSLPFKQCEPSCLNEYVQSKQIDDSQVEKILKGTKILLAEDSMMNQMVASELLTKVGVVVQIANNGIEALKMVQESQPQLILMDIQMPLMDGYTATQEIRKITSDSLPIIAMTANVMPEDQQKCREVGMNGHISKPIDPQELYNELITWINADTTIHSKSSPSLLSQTTQQQTILAVDDTVDNLTLLNELLGTHYLLRSVTSGKKALALVEKSAPDLILLDIMMPDMDGYEVCRQLKQNPKTADIPIIFLSSKSDSKDKAYALSLGAADYISKPLESVVLQECISTQLEL